MWECKHACGDVEPMIGTYCLITVYRPLHSRSIVYRRELLGLCSDVIKGLDWYCNTNAWHEKIKANDCLLNIACCTTVPCSLFPCASYGISV